MSALDNRPYQNGLYSSADLYPNNGSWSTKDLSIPETTEIVIYGTTSDKAVEDANSTHAEKMASNAGVSTGTDNKSKVWLWLAVLLVIIVILNF